MNRTEYINILDQIFNEYFEPLAQKYANQETYYLKKDITIIKNTDQYIIRKGFYFLMPRRLTQFLTADTIEENEVYFQSPVLYDCMQTFLRNPSQIEDFWKLEEKGDIKDLEHKDPKERLTTILLEGEMSPLQLEELLAWCYVDKIGIEGSISVLSECYNEPIVIKKEPQIQEKNHVQVAYAINEKSVYNYTSHLKVLEQLQDRKLIETGETQIHIRGIKGSLYANPALLKRWLTLPDANPLFFMGLLTSVQSLIHNHVKKHPNDRLVKITTNTIIKDMLAKEINKEMLILGGIAKANERPLEIFERLTENEKKRVLKLALQNGAKEPKTANETETTIKNEIKRAHKRAKEQLKQRTKTLIENNNYRILVNNALELMLSVQVNYHAYGKHYIGRLLGIEGGVTQNEKDQYSNVIKDTWVFIAPTNENTYIHALLKRNKQYPRQKNNLTPLQCSMKQYFLTYAIPKLENNAKKTNLKNTEFKVQNKTIIQKLNYPNLDFRTYKSNMEKVFKELASEFFNLKISLKITKNFAIFKAEKQSR